MKILKVPLAVHGCIEFEFDEFEFNLSGSSGCSAINDGNVKGKNQRRGRSMWNFETGSYVILNAWERKTQFY